MKWFRSFTLFFLVLLITSMAATCAAAELTSSNRIDEGVWHKPVFMPSVDAAIGTLRNLGASKSFCGWNGYVDGFDVNVDAYGLRVRGVMAATGTQYVPNNGGYWVGGNYVPYIGGGFQQTKTEAVETAVVDFQKVKMILIWNYPNIDRDNKWGVDVWHTDKRGAVSYRMPTQVIAREFANAVATLTVAAGSRLPTLDGIIVKAFAEDNDKLRKKLKWTANSGVAVLQVEPGSPAALAALRKDDIILELNGAVLTDFDHYLKLVQDTMGDKPEAKFDLKVFRSGAQLPLSMTLANFNNGAAAIQKPGQPVATPTPKPSLGMDLVALTAEEAKAADIPGGLKIISVKPDGLAAKSQLKANDILLAVNGKLTSDVEALRLILAGETPKQYKILRDGAAMTVEAVQSF